VLVLPGVRLDGAKELIALIEGLRQSTESWADLPPTRRARPRVGGRRRFENGVPVEREEQAA
jgi:hypothetical protein